jgi:transcriptional regulator with XRE-family HTH domain
MIGAIISIAALFAFLGFILAASRERPVTEQPERINDPALTLIGELIRVYRRAANMTQDRLADLTDYTRTSITNIEAGRQDLTMTKAIAITKALGIPPGDLLGSGDAARAMRVLAEENRRLCSRITAAPEALDGSAHFSSDAEATP